MSKWQINLLKNIVKSIDQESIALPEAPDFSSHDSQINQAIDVLEATIGEAAQSDYYKCSRERLKALFTLSILSIEEGGVVLDVGNAPGYLGIALFQSGYTVHGINLSRSWDSTYPDTSWLDKLNVKVADIEKNNLPYDSNSFDAIVFTEVLEHIAVKHPEYIFSEFKRVLKAGGKVLFSTPNICNISNILALVNGLNIFWPVEIFYGSTDRHNREWTPKEVSELFKKCGYKEKYFFGMNDHANWRTGTAETIYSFLETGPYAHPLVRNTIIASYELAD